MENKTGVLAFMNDITGQAAQPERKLSAKLKKCADERENARNKSSVLPSSHSGSISAPAILDQFEAEKKYPISNAAVSGASTRACSCCRFWCRGSWRIVPGVAFWIGGTHRVAPLGDGAVGFQKRKRPKICRSS